MVTAVSINKNFVFTGDSHGVVAVWNLSSIISGNEVPATPIVTLYIPFSFSLKIIIKELYLLLQVIL